MASKVNLDAFIQREDFEILERQSLGQTKSTISINDLKRTEFFYSVLRKPDFQRETSEWDIAKVAEFIESFLEGDLIPAVILWKSSSQYIFVVDGSHRLSALAAWINDDYGDKDISRIYYEGYIHPEQLKIAERARRQIEKKVGSFQIYQNAIQHPKNYDSNVTTRAQRLGSLAIQLQWVEGDAGKAEASFFKINQKAQPIDKTELKVLEARKKPTGIAARAILRSGKGHKYWSRFSKQVQSEIEGLANDINSLLFNPPLESPIKTLDLPIGGKTYSAQTLPLILELIYICNRLNPDRELDDDHDGKQTIQFLKTCKKVAERINSLHPGSLGLHPIIYFYSQTGVHKPASFYAVASLILELEQKRLFDKFTSVRKAFEEIVLEYDYLVQQIVRQFRGAPAASPHIKEFYLLLINRLGEGKSKNAVIKEILAEEKYKYLVSSSPNLPTDQVDFSSQVKSQVFIREALKNPIKCRICGGLLHTLSITIDHEIRVRDGGKGAQENAQLAHPYCNSTYKN
ncbi:MAG: DUF262 domain-containing protein [Anaerolineales bacterium]